MIALKQERQSYLDLSVEIEEEWKKLQKIRRIQQYSTTKLTVKKITFEQESIEKRFE